MRADPARQTPLRQVEYLLLLSQSGLGDIETGVIKRQLNVGADHVFLQFKLRLTLLGGADVRQIQRLLAFVTFPPPQIQRVAQAKRRIVVPGASIGQRSRPIKLIIWPGVAHQTGAALDLQRLARFSDACHRPGLPHTGSSKRQAWAAQRGEFDPAIQLRITVGPPPLRCRPMSVACSALDGLVGCQAVDGQDTALLFDAMGCDTRADDQRQSQNTEGPEPSDDATRHSCEFPTEGNAP